MEHETVATTLPAKASESSNTQTKPLKYYVVGDVHGDISHAAAVMRAAENEGVSVILQVGDFGIWDHEPSGVYFLDQLNALSEKRGVHWYVTLGNHENYDSIEKYQALSTGSFIKIRDRITVLGNKTGMFELDGLVIASVGGAYSIDKESRVLGKSWWPQETTTYSDLEKLEALVGFFGKADILLTHDSPTSLPMFYGFQKGDLASAGSRKMMDIIYGICKPELWFHGHYHRALEYKHEDAQVVGLGANPPAMYGIEKYNHGSVVLLTNDIGKITYAYDHEWIYA